MSRSYHNMTLKYNIYFNGNEAYKRGINRINSSNKENYTQVLPIFVDSKEDLASSAAGEMDKAIQKAAKGIKLHSITTKPEKSSSRRGSTKKDQNFYNQSEFNKWVDDAYLLMGKAYFIKRDYAQAKQNFEFIIRQFPNEDIKYDAYLFLARTYSEQGFYKDAKATLDLIEAQKEFPKKKFGMLNLVYADYYLKQKQYESAVPKLERAVELTKKRKEKSRYLFILAQIYEKQGNIAKATELYEQASKKNSSYEMEFNAKMNVARCYAMQGKDTRDIRKKLLKMLKDEKNIEYKDQIYYAIGEIDYNTDKIDDAVENYKKSSEVSIDNDYQKAISSLKAGEIYFSRLDYRNAQVYYDTAVMFLPTNHENYQKIRTNSVNLNELIKYVDIVELQDSVQVLAKLDENERNKIIDKLIADVIEQERLEREMENQTRMNSMMFDQRRGGANSSVASNDGKWYFYSPSQISFGKNEFSKKWGNRKNEDNWRRKDKGIVDMFAMDGDESEDSTAVAAPRVTNNKSRDYYLQDIPLTDSALNVSHEKIINALYNIGGIYKDRFSDYKKSIDAYEDLIKRYPDNEYLLYSYYNLYLLNKLIGNQERMQYYQDLITSKFPDTNYAKILKNPNYIKEQEVKRRKDEQFYIDTYDKYMEGRCDIVANNVRKFLKENEEESDNDLIPKFEFFNTLCVGKFSDSTEFKSSLIDFMQKYADDELAIVAQNILEYFGTEDIQALINELKSRPDVVRPDLAAALESEEDEEETETATGYTYNENAEHYYVIYVKSEDVDVKRLSFEVRNFNIFNFSMRTFNVINTIFNNDYELISVRSFRNQRQSVNYSKMISNNEDIFGRLKDKNYKTFVISTENFIKLQESNKIESYMRFYDKNYNK